MKNISLNFFGEEVSINMPTSLSSLRQQISEKFLFSPSDAAEIVLSYAKDLGKKIIETEKDFVNFISDKINRLDLDISQDSKLYLNSLNSLQNKNEETKKELDAALKKRDEIRKRKEEVLKKKKEEILKMEEEIQKMKKERKKLKRSLHKETKQFRKEEKKNEAAISKLEEKLGIVRNDNIEPAKEKESKPLKAKRTHVKSDYNKKVEKLADKFYKEINVLTKKEIDLKLKKVKKMQPMNKDTVNAEGKAVHHRYICDGCGMAPIVGSRFKCTVCEDFDYCENCEEKFKDQHKHPFLKIYKPSMAPLKLRAINYTSTKPKSNEYDEWFKRHSVPRGYQSPTAVLIEPKKK